MAIHILSEPITRAQLQKIADERFGDLVKAVVDVEKKQIALGAELHADAQVLLIEEKDSSHEYMWGINLYPATEGEGFIEYDSLINLKPAFNNRTRGVDSEEIQKQIQAIVRSFITDV